jgi:hypothetical protein
MTDPDEITADNAGIPDPELPRAAFEQAMFEFLSMAAEGQNLPPGLSVRIGADPELIEVLSRDRVIAIIVRSALLERAGIIAGQRN